MASIENREVLKRIEKECFVSPAAEAVPKQLSNTVVPVIVANPERICEVVRHGVLSNATTYTLYTTSADKDFYLTGVSVSMMKDNTATTTAIDIRADVDGVARRLVSIPSITLTADRDSLSLSFPTPIKIDRASNIILASGTAVANIVANGTIIGFEVSPQ